MTDREKLVDLLDIIIQPGQKTLGEIADHLLANGVTFATDTDVPGTNVGNKWIPMSERFPKNNEFVLFRYAKNNRNPTLFAKNTMAVGRYEHGVFLVEGCAVSVTHWMPLPEPPKEGE